MRETEITFEVFGEFDKTILDLKKQGYKEVETCIMTDSYFTSINEQYLKTIGYQELMKNSLLIRQIAGKTLNSYAIYKNKNFDQDGNVISEEKTTCNIDNYEKMLQILTMANFKPWVSLITNYVVMTANNITLLLQNVEGLGLYIEIEEQPYMLDLSSQEKRNELIKIAKSLNLNIGNNFNVKKPFLKFKAK